MATWISVAVFDYRVIFRGVIVNIRGVHAVVNIMACYLRVEKNISSIKTLNMGLGVHRSHVRTHMDHHVMVIVNIGLERISHRFMVFDL